MDNVTIHTSQSIADLYNQYSDTDKALIIQTSIEAYSRYAKDNKIQNLNEVFKGKEEIVGIDGMTESQRAVALSALKNLTHAINTDSSVEGDVPIVLTFEDDQVILLNSTIEAYENNGSSYMGVFLSNLLANKNAGKIMTIDEFYNQLLLFTKISKIIASIINIFMFPIKILKSIFRIK